MVPEGSRAVPLGHVIAVSSVPMTASLVEEIRALYTGLRTQVRQRWSRDLPLQDLLTDRWERATALGFGTGSSLYQSTYVYGDVRVGSGTWIGPMAVLDGTGGLEIGSGCDISAGVHIYTHDTVRRALSDGRADVELGRVTIGDHSHIGAQVVITKGVTIGHHSVIGAHSFVNADLPPFSVAFGVPCRRVGTVVPTPDGVSLVYD